MLEFVRRCYRATLGDEAGNVAIIFGLTLPIVIGGAGLGVETSYWYLRDLQLQAAADAAAYGAAVEKRSGSTDDVVNAAAGEIAVNNGFDPATGTITVNLPPQSGPNQTADAVEVILTWPVERYFSAIFSTVPVTERARAVARFKTSANACILALNPKASRAVNIGGNSRLNINRCDVMANSVAGDAINAQGGSVSHVGCHISAGGVDLVGGSHTMDCAKPILHAPPIGDPFADLAAPTISGGCKNVNAAVLFPGHYCHGMTLKGVVTLMPGVYILSGDFQVNANAVVTGVGVTIYLVGDARVSINGTATVDLSAPTSGTYAGMLFIGDRSSTSSRKNVFNGTANSSLTGYLYFASQAMQYLGDFSGREGCTRLVADTVEWSGNATLDDANDCSKYGIKPTPSTQLVTLVE